MRCTTNCNTFCLTSKEGATITSRILVHPQIRQEAPHHTQTLGGATRPALRRGGAGPIDRQLRPDGAGDLHVFHIMHEVPEQGPCGTHLKHEGLTHAEICIAVAMEIGSSHCAAPIQGSATAARAGRSSLA